MVKQLIFNKGIKNPRKLSDKELDQLINEGLKLKNIFDELLEKLVKEKESRNGIQN